MQACLFCGSCSFMGDWTCMILSLACWIALRMAHHDDPEPCCTPEHGLNSQVCSLTCPVHSEAAVRKE